MRTSTVGRAVVRRVVTPVRLRRILLAVCLILIASPLRLLVFTPCLYAHRPREENHAYTRGKDDSASGGREREQAGEARARGE